MCQKHLLQQGVKIHLSGTWHSGCHQPDPILNCASVYCSLHIDSTALSQKKFGSVDVPTSRSPFLFYYHWFSPKDTIVIFLSCVRTAATGKWCQQAKIYSRNLSISFQQSPLALNSRNCSPPGGRDHRHHHQMEKSSVCAPPSFTYTSLKWNVKHLITGAYFCFHEHSCTIHHAAAINKAITPLLFFI